MANRFKHLRDDERGMSFVWVGLGFMAFFAATTLAIDVGMITTARSQAQNSADAGALAGATALVYDDFDNRSAIGPAVLSAINTAKGNDVMHADVSVLPVGRDVPHDRPRARRRLPHLRSQQSGRRAHRAHLRHPHGERGGQRHGRGVAGQCHVVREAVHHSRQMAGERQPGLGSRRYLRPVRHAQRRGHPQRGRLWRAWRRDTTRRWTRVRRDHSRRDRRSTSSPSFYFSWAMPGGTGGDWYRENIAKLQ